MPLSGALTWMVVGTVV